MTKSTTSTEYSKKIIGHLSDIDIPNSNASEIKQGSDAEVEYVRQACMMSRLFRKLKEEGKNAKSIGNCLLTKAYNNIDDQPAKEIIELMRQNLKDGTNVKSQLIKNIKSACEESISLSGGSRRTKKSRKGRKKKKNTKTRHSKGGMISDHSASREECGICYDGGDDLMSPHGQGGANHLFHRECIQRWKMTCMRNNAPTTCPVCRVVINLPAGPAGNECGLCLGDEGPFISSHREGGPNHLFHRDCLNDWRFIRRERHFPDTCPICQMHIDNEHENWHQEYEHWLHGDWVPQAGGPGAPGLDRRFFRRPAWQTAVLWSIAWWRLATEMGNGGDWSQRRH